MKCIRNTIHKLQIILEICVPHTTNNIRRGCGGVNAAIAASNCKLIGSLQGGGCVAALWDRIQGRSTLSFFSNGNGEIVKHSAVLLLF